MDSIPAEHTEVEVAFVARQLPRPSHRSLLDVCCGPGRHAAALAERGYRVFGVDADEAAVARARSIAAAGASFEVLDMRRLDAVRGQFDGVLNLWHSFGYFDDASNEAVLCQMAAKVRPGGRMVIDVYNREHLARLPATESGVRGGVGVSTRRIWSGSRLRVVLEYESGTRDEIEWRLYTPAEFSDLCRAARLRPLLACAWFTESIAPSAEHARMQFVLTPEARR